MSSVTYELHNAAGVAHSLYICKLKNYFFKSDLSGFLRVSGFQELVLIFEMMRNVLGLDAQVIGLEMMSSVETSTRRDFVWP